MNMSCSVVLTNRIGSICPYLNSFDTNHSINLTLNFCQMHQNHMIKLDHMGHDCTKNLLF